MSGAGIWSGLARPGAKLKRRQVIQAGGYAYLTTARDAGPQGMRAADASKAYDLEIPTVRVHLSRLHSRGLLQRVSRGAYGISPLGLQRVHEFEQRKGIKP